MFAKSLLSGREVTPDPLALMEVMTHHALTEQKKDYRQDNRKQ
jgi:hypothetical protein